MNALALRVGLFRLLACGVCVLWGAGCVRPTLINGGNTGQNPLDGFDGTGGGSNGGAGNSDDDPVNSNGTDDDDSGPTNQLNPFALDVLFTDLHVDPAGWIQAGDDLVAVGTGIGSGVQYFIPSESSPIAKNISNIESFALSGFAVTGKWIVVRNLEGEVFVFNAETETLTAINPEEFAVSTGLASDRPDFRADGDLVAAVMNRDLTTDDSLYKVLSLNGPTPQIVALTQNPPDATDQLNALDSQVAVDGANFQVAAQVNDTIYVYNLALNNAAPIAFDFSEFGGVSNEKPMWLDGIGLMYLGKELSETGDRIIFVARLGIGITSPVPVSPSTLDDFALINGQFGYFAKQSDSDRLLNRQTRSVFGRFIGQMPTVDSDAINNATIGDIRDEGVYGFGQNLAISPNGEYRFLAGGGSEDSADLLQISKDVTWDVFNDPRAADEDDPLLHATDVTTSDNVCAFITGTDRIVGYILLD
ncbi:MAG TPA: hypothetical protein PKN33_05880 [Phycisphaerae bacterium]|nr:hypothetical protein [Phycisphaerae bacterium]